MAFQYVEIVNNNDWTLLSIIPKQGSTSLNQSESSKSNKILNQQIQNDPILLNNNKVSKQTSINNEYQMIKSTSSINQQQTSTTTKPVTMISPGIIAPTPIISSSLINSNSTEMKIFNDIQSINNQQTQKTNIPEAMIINRKRYGIIKNDNNQPLVSFPDNNISSNGNMGKNHPDTLYGINTISILQNNINEKKSHFSNRPENLNSCLKPESLSPNFCNRNETTNSLLSNNLTKGLTTEIGVLNKKHEILNNGLPLESLSRDFGQISNLSIIKANVLTGFGK